MKTVLLVPGFPETLESRDYPALIKAISWSPFIQDARNRHEAWEKRVESLRWGNSN